MFRANVKYKICLIRIELFLFSIHTASDSIITVYRKFKLSKILREKEIKFIAK